MPTSVEERIVKARVLMVNIERLAHEIAAAREKVLMLETDQLDAQRALLDLEVRPEDVWDSFTKESPR